jgi:C_GCAxxG_C_C family probable redox protein
MEKDIKTLVSEYAAENFKGGLNCAESVMEALVRSGALKVPKEIVGLSTGFGGGVGLSGNTCGALSAAVLANSAVYGRPDPWAVPQEERGKEIAAKYYRRYNKLVNDFSAKNGSAECREICKGYDFGSKERRVNCLKVVVSAAELAYDMLQMPQEEAFTLPYGKNMGGNK